MIPQPQSQSPAVHHIRIGDITVTAIADGVFDLDISFLPKAQPELVHEEQKTSFLPVGQTVPSGVNTFLVNTGEELILIDTGARSLAMLGDKVGNFMTNLKAAGIEPSAVDRVVLSHMHADHTSGLVDDAGEAVFQAPLHVHEADWNFWTSEEVKSQSPVEMHPFFDAAVAHSAPYKDRLELYQDGTGLGKGLTAIHLPGHTPGHCGYMISSGNDQLMIFTDTVHAAALQFAHPDWAIGFDVDQDQAVATRTKVFDQLVTDRTLFTGMHLPFPGFGHLDRSGSTHSFVPLPWQYQV